MNREIQAIGASEREAKAYVRGMRRGGVVVFATGSNAEVDKAAEIMNRHGAIEVEELIGREPNTGGMIDENMPAVHDISPKAGESANRAAAPGCLYGSSSRRVQKTQSAISTIGQHNKDQPIRVCEGHPVNNRPGERRQC